MQRGQQATVLLGTTVKVEVQLQLLMGRMVSFMNYTFYELRNLQPSSISPFKNPILVIQIKSYFTNFGCYELRNLSVYLC